MGFLSSIWLFAVAAISIPVIIHLWNVKPGKTLKVGSIALIEVSSRKSSRSFKLIDILLLLLRCLFLILIATVLAMPYIQKGRDESGIKGWLLIPKENFKEVYKNFKPKVDSLLNAGYELHYFNYNFKKAVVKEALADTTASPQKKMAPYWSLLQQLDRLAPAKLPIYLITPNLLNNFAGNRPKIALNLKWDTYTPSDSTVIWIEKAWFTADKNVHVIVGTGKPSGTYFNAVNISSDDGKGQPYHIGVNNGKAIISASNNKQSPVAIDTATLTVDVFADNNAPDAKYVKAALQTVSQFTKHPINIKSFGDNNNLLGRKNWLFWLSDKAINPKTISRYQHVLVYESGKTVAVNSWICPGAGNSVTPEQQAISLYKSVIGTTYPAEVVWHDGFGKLVLGRDYKGNTAIYHFYSRFNPSWNDLVWNANFPKIMLQLMMDDGFLFDKAKYDRRIIDKQQLKPIVIKEVKTSQNNYKLNTDVTRYFWLLLVLIFLAERWLANKKQLT